MTSVDVTLSDGVIASSSLLPFWRILPPTLLRISPASVPAGGASLVTIHGHGFTPGVVWECLSSGTRTHAGPSRDGTTLACAVSPSAPGQLGVEANPKP